MVVQNSNYNKFSITVKHTQHTVSVHYSIRDPTFFLQLIFTLFSVRIYTIFNDNDLLLLVK